MKFATLKKQIKKEEPDILGLTQTECILFLSLIAESDVKVKNIQQVYDLIYKIQEFIQEK